MGRPAGWLIALAFLLGASECSAQVVTAPTEVRVQPGRLAQVVIESDSPGLQFKVLSKDLDAFREYPPPDAKPHSVYLRVQSSKPGTHQIVAACAKGDKVSSFALVSVVVEGEVKPDPTPDPKPGPKPEPIPVPPKPVPQEDPPFDGKDGLRVLIVIESMDLSKYPPSQHNAIYSFQVREYMSQKCAPSESGSAAWRVFDQNDDGYADSKLFGDALKRANAKKTKTPWVIVGNGRRYFEGPLPGDTAAFLTLLKQYGDQ